MSLVIRTASALVCYCGDSFVDDVPSIIMGVASFPPPFYSKPSKPNLLRRSYRSRNINRARESKRQGGVEREEGGLTPAAGCPAPWSSWPPGTSSLPCTCRRHDSRRPLCHVTWRDIRCGRGVRLLIVNTSVRTGTIRRTGRHRYETSKTHWDCVLTACLRGSIFVFSGGADKVHGEVQRSNRQDVLPLLRVCCRDGLRLNSV